MTEQRFFRLILYVAAVAAAIFLLFRFLLPVLLPFGIGFLLARLAEPPVRALSGHIPRGAASTLVMAGVFLILSLGLYLLIQSCASGVGKAAAALPALLESLREPMASLRETLLRLAGRVPDGLGAALRAWVEQLFSGTSTLLEKASDSVLGMASGMVSCLPGIFLFLLTAIVSSFMFSAEGERVPGWLREKMPKAWQKKLTELGGHFRQAIRGWLRAELRLMAATFILVSAGLLFLRVPSPLPVGGLIALVDALPVLGTGTVLIPWALFRLLRGETVFGVALLVLYGLTVTMRTALEPRFVGRQIGLHPLITLLSMYAGFTLFGLPGMLLLPIAALMARQLWVYGDFGA